MAISPHCNSAANRAVHRRLVLDICALSKALVRQRVQIPTANKILRKLEEATVFTKVKLSWIYLSIDARRRIRVYRCDGHSHCFNRLILGVSPSGGHFHEIIHGLINDIPGCANISEIWLWPNSKEAHYTQLEQLFQTLESSSITLNYPNIWVVQIKCCTCFSNINSRKHIRHQLKVIKYRMCFCPQNWSTLASSFRWLKQDLIIVEPYLLARVTLLGGSIFSLFKPWTRKKRLRF